MAAWAAAAVRADRAAVGRDDSSTQFSAVLLSIFHSYIIASSAPQLFSLSLSLSVSLCLSLRHTRTCARAQMHALYLSPAFSRQNAEINFDEC